MTSEAQIAKPTETELLIARVNSLMDEASAKTEISRLRVLRNQVFTFDVYYNMLYQMDGQNSPSTQTALGMLYVKIKEFAARVEKLGLDSKKYTTANSILSLFPSTKDIS